MDFAKALRRGLTLDKVNEKDLQVLQEMFQGSDLSRSVYTTVLEENNGKLDAAIDTLLNLANDPLHEQPTAQEAQPPPPATQEAQSLLSEHVASPAPPCLEPAQEAQPLVPSPVEEAPLQLSVTADSNLTSSPATSSSPVLSRAPLPVFAPSEVLSVLQTQVIMADDFITSLSPPVAKSLPGPLPLQQSPSMCKLVCPTSARQGDVVGVSWDLGPDVQPSPKDWIGLFQQNQPSNTQYVYYKKTGGDRRGILDVRSPGLGTWEFRFFPNGTYNCMMKSNLLIIGPQLELEATLCEEEASNESNIVVSCRVLSGQVSSSDWIGLYNVETYDNTTYLGLRYVENVDGLATARFTFPAPRKPGHYELRYFPAASAYNDVARSNLITVEDRDVLIVTPSRVVAESDDKLMATWQVHSVPTSKWDWVGLFAVGSSTYVEYHYVDPTKEELACQFAVPRQPGHYELRYHASATSSFLDRRSSRITVLAPSSRVSSSASSC